MMTLGNMCENGGMNHCIKDQQADGETYARRAEREADYAKRNF